VSVACGFIGFFFYLILGSLCIVGLSPGTGFTVSSYALMFGFTTTALLRQLKQSERKKRITTSFVPRPDRRFMFPVASGRRRHKLSVGVN